jgi:hypothetical protein
MPAPESHRRPDLVPSYRWWLVVAALLSACAPASTNWTHARPPHDPLTLPCSGADAGPAPDLPDSAPAREDAAMSLPPTEPFAIEPATPRVSVHRGERTFLAVRLERAPTHHAYVELKASGLPAGVAAIAAFGPEPSQLGLVIEASDTAREIADPPITLEAHANGVRVSRRVLLTILAAPESSEE